MFSADKLHHLQLAVGDMLKENLLWNPGLRLFHRQHYPPAPPTHPPPHPTPHHHPTSKYQTEIAILYLGLTNDTTVNSLVDTDLFLVPGVDNTSDDKGLCLFDGLFAELILDSGLLHLSLLGDMKYRVVKCTVMLLST